MRRLKPGFTLHEMLISLTVLGGVLALAAHLAMGQLRFFRGVGDVTDLTSQLGEAGDIAAAMIWHVSPSADLLVAQDSAIELRLTTGAAVLCSAGPGHVVLPAPGEAGGNTLAAFVKPPDAGDRMSALFDDSVGTSWLSMRVEGPPVEGTVCPAFPWLRRTWIVAVAGQPALRAGAPLHFSRPIRLSLYRAADGRWFLGARDWNGATGQFNTIQPVAGPVRPWSPDPARTGLRFVYRDRDGAELAEPVNVGAVTSITVVSRAALARPVRIRGMDAAGAWIGDSSAIVVALRNAP